MRKVLKALGIAIGSLVVLAILAGVVVGLLGQSRLNRTYEGPRDLPALPLADASAAYGERIAHTRGCYECHGEGLAGQVFLDIPPGLIVAPNLTRGRGGVGGRYEPPDWDRAIRYGIRPDGRWIRRSCPTGSTTASAIATPRRWSRGSRACRRWTTRSRSARCAFPAT